MIYYYWFKFFLNNPTVIWFYFMWTNIFWHVLRKSVSYRTVFSCFWSAYRPVLAVCRTQASFNKVSRLNLTACGKVIVGSIQEDTSIKALCKDPTYVTMLLVQYLWSFQVVCHAMLRSKDMYFHSGDYNSSVHDLSW